MDENVKSILEKNKDLIENEDFYTLIRKTPSFARHSIVEVFMNAGIDLLHGMPEIPPYMFASIPLTEITIPTNIKLISFGAFQNCEKLREVNLSSGIKNIDHEAFQGCESLEQINLPQSLLYIGEAAFKKCHMLTKIDIPGTIKFISDYAFLDCARLNKVHVQDGIESIGQSAFYKCSSLQAVRLPASLELIAQGAFFFTAPKLSISYAGTVEQWNKIDIHPAAFDGKSEITVKCLDKRIKLKV